MSGFYYIKIANGLLEPKHCEAMGDAVWLYMWLQDKCTSINENGEGKVLGNQPIVYEEHIKPVLGIPRRTYARWVDRLRDAGYIKTIRTPRGLTVVITKAKKYTEKGSAKSTHHDVPKTTISKSDVPKSHSDVPKTDKEVPKSHIQYKTIQGLHKDYTSNTNVLEPDKPARYGKLEINEIFDYWQEHVGYQISSKVQMNRNAASNLIKRHGPEGVQQLIRGVALAHEDKYAPGIADFIQLQSKLNDLLKWGKSKGKNNATAQF